ncbi:MAG: ABC transporter permease subunit [Caldilineaceae bacterium]|nr:ABC transporter permease subunit [Caldilineaceae bacterium]
MQLSINPIIIKELRSRMRGARAFVLLTVMLLLLAGFTYGLYQFSMVAAGYSTVLSPVVGRSLFTGLALAELLIICFITPALTAGAISGEREKLTYDMLMTTPLSAAAILWGKLFSALSYVLLLIFAAIPIASLVFIFGGVAPREMLNALLVLVAVAITLGVIGIFMSAWLGRTGRATIGSYLVVLLMMIAPVAAYIATGVINQAEPPRELLILNPLSALLSVMAASAMSNGPLDILIGLGAALGGNLGRLTGQATGAPRPLFHYSLPIYALLSIVLYVAAIQLVKPARRRINKREIGGAVLAAVALAAIAVAFFFTTADHYSAYSPLRPGLDNGVAMSGQAQPAVLVEPPIPTATPAAPDEQQVDTPELSALTDVDRAALYALAIQQTFEASLLPTAEVAAPTYHIRTSTDDTIAFPDGPISATVELTQTVQDAITIQLGQQGAQEAIWVADAQDAAEAPPAIYQVTLSNLHAWTDDAILVSVKISSNDYEWGLSYAMHRDNQGWRSGRESVATWEK